MQSTIQINETHQPTNQSNPQNQSNQPIKSIVHLESQSSQSIKSAAPIKSTSQSTQTNKTKSAHFPFTPRDITPRDTGWGSAFTGMVDQSNKRTKHPTNQIDQIKSINQSNNSLIRSGSQSHQSINQSTNQINEPNQPTNRIN